MAISINNTDGAGYTAYKNGSGTWADASITTPSDAGSDDLLVEFLAASYPISPGFTAWTPTLNDVTGEAEVGSGLHYDGTSHDVEVHALYAALSSSPSTLNVTADGLFRRSALGLLVNGHDTGSPIRAYATGSGNGTTVTFPDTSSVNDGDMVLRFVHIGKEDTSLSFDAVSGVTDIWSDPASGNFAGGDYLGYSIKSGAGAPGTATMGLTAGGNRDWVAMTIVVAVAGGGSPITDGPALVSVRSNIRFN